MEPLRLGELADHIGVSDPTASRSVEALVVGGPRGAHPPTPPTGAPSCSP